MEKKHSWVKAAAIITTLMGAVVAVAAYVKNKSKRLNEELDFDNSLYFDEDSSLLDDDMVDGDDAETLYSEQPSEPSVSSSEENSEPSESPEEETKKDDSSL